MSVVFFKGAMQLISKIMVGSVSYGVFVFPKSFGCCAKIATENQSIIAALPTSIHMPLLPPHMMVVRKCALLSMFPVNLPKIQA